MGVASGVSMEIASSHSPFRTLDPNNVTFEVGLQLQARQEQLPEAPVPLPGEGLGPVTETHMDAAGEVRPCRAGREIDVHLEHPFHGLQALGITGVHGNGPPTLASQKTVRQLIRRRGHFALYARPDGFPGAIREPDFHGLGASADLVHGGLG